MRARQNKRSGICKNCACKLVVGGIIVLVTMQLLHLHKKLHESLVHAEAVLVADTLTPTTNPTNPSIEKDAAEEAIAAPDELPYKEASTGIPKEEARTLRRAATDTPTATPTAVPTTAEPVVVSEPCTTFDVYKTPVGSVFGDEEAVGFLDSKAFCLPENAAPQKTVVIAICRERYSNFWKWIAPTIFPEARTKMILTDDASWEGHSDQVPDVSFCSCSQGNCHSKSMIAKRHELISKSSRTLGDKIKGSFGKWDSWREFFVWTEGSKPPAYKRKEWPLMVKYNLEPWGTGDCSDWDLNLDVKWNSKETQDANPPWSTNFQNCPTMLFPFVLLHFAHRADKSISDMLIPSGFDAAAELAKKDQVLVRMLCGC
jgi:hypothetical protein